MAVLTLIAGILAIPGVVERLHDILALVKQQRPIWSDVRDAYVGDAIVLKWNFDKGASAFEVEHARDAHFDTDVRRFFTDVYQKVGNDPYSRRVEEIHNETRFFRVRAVNPRDYAQPLSGWSDVQRIAQYDSAYQRIVVTRSVIIGISKIDHNDLFKWASSIRDGIDIRLVKSIVAELSTRVSTPPALAETFDPVAWPEILDAPALGRTDMAVAAISRGSKREVEHGISFSDPYFCTTQALIYRINESGRSVRDMIAGKRVGFEKYSTSERLVRAMVEDLRASGGTLPELRGEDRPEDITYAVGRREIDVGVTDLPFAVEAILTARRRGDTSLTYRPLKKSELPSSLPKENQLDEYAIAIRRGDQLLKLVNDILKQFKNSGGLAGMIKATTHDYEQFKGFSRGELADAILQPQPWECQS